MAGGFSDFPRGKIRKERRARKRARKAENTHLGGSRTEERALYKDAKDQSAASAERADKSYGRLDDSYEDTKEQQGQEESRYSTDRGEAKLASAAYRNGIQDIKRDAGTSQTMIRDANQSSMDMRNSALATGSLVQSTDSVLANREATLAAAPTIGAATETAIAANQANAQAQTQYAQGRLNQNAMGLAAGQGESGALALQQAIASAGAGGADIAAQSNMQQAQQNAGMRFDAAAQQRAEVVGGADAAVAARLAAAGAERTNQMAVADKNATQSYGAGTANAELNYNSGLATQDARNTAVGQAQAQQGLSSARNLTLSGQQANIATGGAQIANAGEATDKGYQSDILTAKFNAGQARNADEGRSTLKKVFLPFGILGN